MPKALIVTYSSVRNLRKAIMFPYCILIQANVQKYLLFLRLLGKFHTVTMVTDHNIASRKLRVLPKAFIVTYSSVRNLRKVIMFQYSILLPANIQK